MKMYYSANLQFNPVSLALELMDNSSLGKDVHQFTKLLRRLHTEVERVVEG